MCSVPYKVSEPLLLPTINGRAEPYLNIDCLAKNSYKEEKCQAQVDALYECCNLFYERQGDGASTVSCPKASLLKLKMRHRDQNI